MEDDMIPSTQSGTVAPVPAPCTPIGVIDLAEEFDRRVESRASEMFNEWKENWKEFRKIKKDEKKNKKKKNKKTKKKNNNNTDARSSHARVYSIASQ